MASQVYSCMIVDDEVLAQQLITHHLSNYAHLEIKGCFSSAIEANEFLKTQSIDLIFLDIEMPKVSGLDWLRTLENPPKVILTTAYSDFALEGFELNVLDYLLKPITANRFEQAIEKFNEWNQIKESVESNASKDEDCLLIKSSHELVRVQISDIYFIEAMHKYVKIFTKEGMITTLYSISQLEEELSDSFYRVHRSYLVNILKVDKVKGNEAVLGEYVVPISKGNKAEFIERLGKQL